MLRSLYSGASGMRSHQARMDVIGNNIANVNTTGFKSGRAEFKDALSQTIRGGSTTTNPMQIGTGVTVSTIFNDFGQGALRMTDRTLDVAIEGNGFFRVAQTNDPDEFDPASTPESIYYTRDGCFFITKDGYLVNNQGYYVLGYDSSNNDGVIKFYADDNNDGVNDVLPLKSISIAKDGTISAIGNNDNEDKFTINLAVFTNNEGLKKVGENLYAETTASGAPTVSAPGTGAAGTLSPGYLEMSNVDLTKEFTDMITTQRGFQANSRVITVSDTILEELVNLKR